MSGKKIIKLVFPIIYTLLILFSVICMMIKIINPEYKTNGDVFVFFLNSIGIVSIVITAFYLIGGTLIIYKLKGTFSLLSPSVLSFLSVSLIFSGCSA